MVDSGGGDGVEGRHGTTPSHLGGFMPIFVSLAVLCFMSLALHGAFCVIFDAIPLWGAP